MDCPLLIKISINSFPIPLFQFMDLSINHILIFDSFSRNTPRNYIYLLYFYHCIIRSPFIVLNYN